MNLMDLPYTLAASVVVRVPELPGPVRGVFDPKPNAPDKLKSLMDTLLGLLAWAGTAAGVAGVLITGVMMAISMKRGESSEHMSRLGMVLGGCILVSGAGPLADFFL
ncbi:hypothetical protein ACIG87_29320 [Micromonospora sp. NPDC051925]|uniref:hypothetical protein n=1 Tax=Micromonospora sp. NPDC051925 TaxID=3364288 RepID=UPI0037C4F7EF